MVKQNRINLDMHGIPCLPNIVLGKDSSESIITLNPTDHSLILVGGTRVSPLIPFLQESINETIEYTTPEAAHIALIDPCSLLHVHEDEKSRFWSTPIHDIHDGMDVMREIIELLESRYADLDEVGASDIDEYIQRSGEKRARILVIIPEIAMLLHAYPTRMEMYIHTLRRFGKRCGIHTILATRQPVERDMRLIRESIDCSIAFPTYDVQESCCILGSPGAKELGGGELLYMEQGKDTRKLRSSLYP